MAIRASRFLLALVGATLLPAMAWAADWVIVPGQGGLSPVADLNQPVSEPNRDVERLQASCPSTERWQFFITFATRPETPGGVALTCNPGSARITSCSFSGATSGFFVYCPRADVRRFLTACGAQARDLRFEFTSPGQDYRIIADFPKTRDTMVELTRQCGT